MATQRQKQDFSNLLADQIEVSMQLASLDTAVEFIQENMEPEDVFSEKQLDTWAEANGYVKSDE